MTPDMSVNQMLDSFIYIVKGSRVIDRRATDWGRYLWLDEKYVRHLHVYTVAELKRYFSHRRHIKWNGKTVYLFDEWFAHPRRFTAPALSGAMKLADMAARGLIEPYIDLKAIISNATPRPPMPDWVKRGVGLR